MTDDPRKETRTCADCGAQFDAWKSTTTNRCPACYRAYRTAYAREYKRKRTAGEDTSVQRVVVIRDPLPWYDGGFSSGVKFDTREADDMLRVCAWTPGTVIEIPRHGVCEVVALPNGRQFAIAEDGHKYEPRQL